MKKQGWPKNTPSLGPSTGSSHGRRLSPHPILAALILSLPPWLTTALPAQDNPLGETVSETTPTTENPSPSETPQNPEPSDSPEISPDPNPEEPAQSSQHQSPAEDLSGHVQGFVPLGRQEYAEKLLNRAVSLFQKNRLDEALPLLDEVLRMFPNDLFALNMRGACLAKLRRFEEARTVFTHLLNLDPNYLPARFNLGELLFLEGKRNEALMYFDAMQELYPGNSLIQYKRVLLLLANGKIEDAKRLAARLPVINEQPLWYYAHAAIAMAEGRPARARSLLKAAQEVFPETVNWAFISSLQDMELYPN